MYTIVSFKTLHYGNGCQNIKKSLFFPSQKNLFWEILLENSVFPCWPQHTNHDKKKSYIPSVCCICAFTIDYYVFFFFFHAQDKIIWRCNIPLIRKNEIGNIFFSFKKGIREKHISILHVYPYPEPCKWNWKVNSQGHFLFSLTIIIWTPKAQFSSFSVSEGRGG